MKEIPLSGERGKGLVMLVDDEDYDRVVAAGPWRPNFSMNKRLTGAQTNVKINGKWSTMKAHKFITGYPATDHRDHNVLNNQKSNLRPTVEKGTDPNQFPRKGSSSKYKGVYWDERNGRWVSQIRKGNRGSARIYLGSFINEIDAAMAYDKAAHEIHGEFAWLNCDHFPEVPRWDLI